MLISIFLSLLHPLQHALLPPHFYPPFSPFLLPPTIDASREDKLEVLERRCVESGLKTSDIWWYADLRRYGSVPHAGTDAPH
jgi:hypothetical protein